MERENKRYVFITYLRGLAAILIFNCHLLFIANKYELSMWLNVGVPCFFVISAFLMAERKFDSGKEVVRYYKKRFRSIYIPYEIYLACVIGILIILRKPPQIKAIILYALGASAFSDVHVLGLGHFWYISIILICYLLTPILYRINLLEKRCRFPILGVMVVSQFMLFLCIGFPSYGVHVGSYICCFTFFQNKHGILSKKHIQVLLVAAGIFSVFRICFDSKLAAMGGNAYYYYDAVFQPIARLALALGLFSLFYFFSESIEEWNSQHSFVGERIIGAFSGISFEFYLVHQFIELSVWEYVPSVKSGGILAAILFASISFGLSILNAVVLKYIESIVAKITSPTRT